MAAATGVKAGRGAGPGSKQSGFAFERSRNNRSYLRHEGSLLFFAARSDAAVSPPLTLVRFNESRMPWVGTGARFELRVRELRPSTKFRRTTGHIRFSGSGS